MDLTNTNLWIGIIAGIVAIVLGILALLGHLSKLFRWVWAKFQGLISPDPNIIKYPKKTIVLIPKPGHSAWWHMGKRKIGKESDETEPLMQIEVEFTATNITNYKIMLPLAKMKKPRMDGRADIIMRREHGGLIGVDMIPEKNMGLRQNLWVPHSPSPSHGTTVLACVKGPLDDSAASPPLTLAPLRGLSNHGRWAYGYWGHDLHAT